MTDDQPSIERKPWATPVVIVSKKGVENTEKTSFISEGVTAGGFAYGPS